MAEHLAHWRRTGRQRPFGRLTVKVALAGDRALAADVKGGERVELPCLRLADDHAVLLLDRGVGSGRLHPAEFERRTQVFFEVRKDRRRLDRRGRESERRPGAHRAGCLGDLAAVFGDEKARHPVIGPRALDILADDRDAVGVARLDRGMQLVDRRLFETKRPPLGLLGHACLSPERCKCLIGAPRGVIASKAKQSRATLTQGPRLLRRVAPRNDSETRFASSAIKAANDPPLPAPPSSFPTASRRGGHWSRSPRRRFAGDAAGSACARRICRRPNDATCCARSPCSGIA